MSISYTPLKTISLYAILGLVVCASRVAALASQKKRTSSTKRVLN